jgi:hypothetical protein
MDEKLKLQKPTPNEFKKSKLPWNRPMLGKLDRKNEGGKRSENPVESMMVSWTGPS